MKSTNDPFLFDATLTAELDSSDEQNIEICASRSVRSSFFPSSSLSWPTSNDKVDSKGKAPAEEDTHAQSANYYEIEAYESFSDSECTGSVVGGLKVPKSDRLKRHELMAIQAHCLRFIIPFPPDCRLNVNEEYGTSRQFRKEYPAGCGLQFPKSFDYMSVQCGHDVSFPLFDYFLTDLPRSLQEKSDYW